MNRFYTHKKTTPTVTFERLCAVFLDCLQRGKTLSLTQEDWLTRQANIYIQNKNLHTPYEIKLLDRLSEPLGYNWREANSYIEFNKTIMAIENRLTNGGNLLPYQKQWLTTQRHTLLSKPPTPLIESQITSITKATVRLDYNWKLGKVKTTFNRKYQSILDTIDPFQEFSSSQKQWLVNQRKRYTKKENIPVDELVKLTRLIDTLGLDWARERETYRNKKQIKRWLKKFYSAIHCEAIENRIGIPIGTLDLLHTTRLNTATDIDSLYIRMVYDFIIAAQYTTPSTADLTETEQIVHWVKRNYYFLNAIALENTKGIPKEILEEIYLTEQVREPWVLPIQTYIKNF